MAITAIDAEHADMMLMAEWHGLLAHFARPGPMRGRVNTRQSQRVAASNRGPPISVTLAIVLLLR